MACWTERSEQILGSEAIKKLAASRVILFGVGGVGGHIAEALARSGVGQIDLVDPDCVSLSNLNRQLVALQSTLGQKKVEVMQARICDINPDCMVKTYPLFFTPETKDEIDFSSYHYIIDAIDTMAGKLALVEKARETNTPLIAAMGAGNKKNPAGFLIADLAKTEVCPLAKSYRIACRKMGVNHLKVAYSKETAFKPTSVPEETAAGRPVCGSLPFVPAAMGLLIASQVVYDLVDGSGKVPC